MREGRLTSLLFRFSPPLFPSRLATAAGFEKATLSTSRHFKNRPAEGPGDEVGMAPLARVDFFTSRVRRKTISLFALYPQTLTNLEYQ